MITPLLLVIMTIRIIGTSSYDHYRTKQGRINQKVKEQPKLSVIIPCYNDGDTLTETVHSLFASYPTDLIQCILVNDASTDNSQDVIDEVIKIYPIHSILNQTNQGKVLSVNAAADHAEHDLILFIDADVIITANAIEDMMYRIKTNNLGGVSCPYQPSNGGFLATMQAVEYEMMRYLQGSYNLFSAISLRGGCHMITKEAFEAVGRYSIEAITEDMDLAFKLNEHGYRVQQSLVPIQTEVPNTWKKRWKQKIRRNSGGTQCFITHRKVWIKNPLHVIFLMVFQYFGIVQLIGLLGAIVFLDIFVDQRQFLSLFIGTKNIILTFLTIYTPFILQYRVQKVGFMIFSLPYVRGSNQHRGRKRLLLLFPYTIIYFPVFYFLSWIGLVVGRYAYLKQKPGKRGR